MEVGSNKNDIHVECVDCGRYFIFSEGERKFYISKRLTIPPKRCPQCRSERKKRLVPDEEVSHDND